MKPIFALALVLALVPALVLAQTGAFAQAPAPEGPLAPAPRPPAAGFTQRLDAVLPLSSTFTDSGGHAVTLADEITPWPARPTLLMLGYHRCPQLCGVATQGILEALRQSGLPASAARILFVSVDPDETPATRGRAARSTCAMRPWSQAARRPICQSSSAWSARPPASPHWRAASASRTSLAMQRPASRIRPASSWSRRKAASRAT